MPSNVHLQEGIVAGALDINQIGHFSHFFKLPRRRTRLRLSRVLTCDAISDPSSISGTSDALSRKVPLIMGFRHHQDQIINDQAPDSQTALQSFEKRTAPSRSSYFTDSGASFQA